MEAVEQKIESSLQILDQREAKLIELADKYTGLTIAGVEDKEGYKKVREARIELKKERVAVENDAYDLRESAVKFQKAVVAKEKRLVAIIYKTEKTLQEEEAKYQKALEEIKIKKDREEKERIQNRINSLAKFGRAIDLYDATTMPDDKFNELLTQAEIDFNAEQDRIAQEKAEAERLRNEEAARLKAEREELARQRAEIEAAQRKADLELAERSRKEREWIEEQNRIKAEQLAERKKLDDEKRKHEEQIRLEQAKKEAAERARIEEQERIQREEQEKIERERLAKLEAERQEALKPDKEKLMQYAHELMSVPVPVLNHKDAQKLKGSIADRVMEAVLFVQQTAKNL